MDYTNTELFFVAPEFFELVMSILSSAPTIFLYLNYYIIWIIGVPEEEEKKKGFEKIFEEIIVENFPNMGKEIVNQVQEAQRVPYRINPRRNTPRHILIKLSKFKCKEKILKEAREKQQITYKGILIRLTADLSAETLQARRE